MKQVFGDLSHFTDLELLCFSVYRGQFIPNFVMDFRQNRNLRHFKIEQNPFERKHAGLKKDIKADQMSIQIRYAVKDFQLTLIYPDYSFDYRQLETILRQNKMRKLHVTCDFFHVALGT